MLITLVNATAAVLWHEALVLLDPNEPHDLDGRRAALDVGAPAFEDLAN